MKTKIISLLILILLCFSAVSCHQEVIFYDIAREVKLVNPEINGNCYSLVPLAGKLYVQNGDIYSKANASTAHGWTRITKPADAGNVIRLASDADTLYAMTEDLSGVRKLWAKSATGTTWTLITEGVKELFDNQVVDADLVTTGRIAYFTDGNGVKQLSGTSAPASVSAADTFGRTGEADYIKAAVLAGTNTVFSSNAAICVSGTTLYSVDTGKKVIRYSTDCGATWIDGGSISDAALSICAYGTDKLLVGTKNGYEISTINSTTKKPGNCTDSETNAESAFGRNRQVIMIKAFGTSVYAGVIAESSSNYSKLWGWFGTDWNYE